MKLFICYTLLSSEKLFMDMADMIVEKGFQKAGYEYVIIDDCWLDHKRDGSGKLQPDYGRFPSGIKALADYVHGKGLKFGIYEDYGNFTCGGYPGILGHLETDANTFAEWGVDYIKVDGCYADPSTMDQGYPEFGKYLNATGWPIVYSCSWPDYQLAEGKKPNYNLISQHCNLWRNFDDIDDSWVSVLSIIDYYGSSNTSNDFAPVAGPGHWNDPDMLIIGNFGLSLDQSRVQMAIWAVLAAPLIMSNDLRTIRPEFTAILTNAHVIRINQDPMGIQGRRVYSQKNVDIFTKPVLPSSNGVFSEAVAVMYRGSYGTPINVSFLPQALGTNAANAYNFEVVDVFDNTVIGTYRPDEPITVSVNPTGTSGYL
jgi:alpha-N-acetylgalactosaminidase